MSKLNSIITSVSFAQQNCTLLFDEESKKGVLIDPGAEWPRIFDTIKKSGVSVEAIWLTHGHIDHAGAAMDAKDALNVDIIGPHKEDQFLLDYLEETGRFYQLSDSVRNCTPDRWLEDGDELFCGGHKFKVYHTPGHTPGHVIYFNEKAKFALVGDVLFPGTIGRTDFPYGNQKDLLSSIKDKLLPLGDDVEFICGHGPGGTLGAERRTNPFLESMR